MVKAQWRLGSWSSDVWTLYARHTKEVAYSASAVVGSTAFEDLERGEFISEELEMLPYETNRWCDVHFDFDGECDDGDDE